MGALGTDSRDVTLVELHTVAPCSMSLDTQPSLRLHGLTKGR